MTLPIPTTLVVQGASQLAGEVARRVGQAVGFADVLAGAERLAVEETRIADSNSFVDAKSPSQEQLRRELVEAIDRMLQKSGLTLEQPLQLSVAPDGAVRVVSDHERAAEIEARLGSDAEVSQLAQQLAARELSPIDERFGNASRSIDLTLPAATASILPVPGGYPNW